MDKSQKSIRVQIWQLLHAQSSYRASDSLRLQILEVPCPCGIPIKTLVATDIHGPLATFYHAHECSGRPEDGPQSLDELDPPHEDSISHRYLREKPGAGPLQWDETLSRAIAWSDFHPECSCFDGSVIHRTWPGDIHRESARPIGSCTILPEVLPEGGGHR